MTSSSWFLDMVPPMWTKTASLWNRAARESTLRSDIQRHFSLERLRISCSALVLLGVGEGLTSFGSAKDDCAPSVKKHSPISDTFRQVDTGLKFRIALIISV